MGVDTRWESELAVMGWGELARLAEVGWEIGSHTRTHPGLPRLDDEPLRDELEGSRAEVEEHLGRPCRSLAYPYGDLDGRVAERPPRGRLRRGRRRPARVGQRARPAPVPAHLGGTRLDRRDPAAPGARVVPAASGEPGVAGRACALVRAVRCGAGRRPRLT